MTTKNLTNENHATPENDTVVSIRNVMKIFRLEESQVVALKNINLEIRRGEFTAIIGPSGAGKSTLMNVIGCIEIPTLGEVVINGKEVTGMSDRERAKIRNRELGFVFQSFNLIPVLSILENVELPLVLHTKLSSRERIERAKRALADVGLESFTRYYPEKLSGGQRQRVAIARALVTEPALVLADEPTANLDSDTGNQIVNLMLNLNKTNHVTFIFSTHDDRLISRVRRTISIRDGVASE